MSKTKQGGSTKLGRDSEAQRLGIKKYSGQTVKIGNIIVRQRGSKFLAGKNAKKGSDDTIYAVKDGIVKFTDKTKMLFNGTRRQSKLVSVETTTTTKSPSSAPKKASKKVK